MPRPGTLCSCPPPDDFGFPERAVPPRSKARRKIKFQDEGGSARRSKLFWGYCQKCSAVYLWGLLVQYREFHPFSKENKMRGPHVSLEKERPFLFLKFPSMPRLMAYTVRVCPTHGRVWFPERAVLHRGSKARRKIKFQDEGGSDSDEDKTVWEYCQKVFGSSSSLTEKELFDFQLTILREGRSDLRHSLGHALEDLL
ncbi:amiloride-sensitive sodium channel subunit beta-2, partial [Trichonephila inaurata madagascariensis]